MLCALFSSGIFVMVAAFLRAYYSVKNISSLSIALGWASREALVSVITVSAPGIKPLITQSRFFSSYGASSSGATFTGVGSTPNKRRDDKSRSQRGPGSTIGDRISYELPSSLGWKKMRRGSAESQENIIEESEPVSGEQGKDGGVGIMVTTDVSLSAETAHSERSQPS